MSRKLQMRRLRLTPLVYEKIFFYTNASPGEISGFCKTEQSKTDKNLIMVTDVKIFRQQITGADTEIGAEALAEFIVDLARKGEDPSKWNLWWHSHYTFGVFWSGTDEATIVQLKKSQPIYSLVVNQAGDMLARFDQGKAPQEVLGVVMLPWGRGKVKNSTSVRRGCRAEVKRLVTEKKYTNSRGIYLEPTSAGRDYQFSEAGELDGYFSGVRVRRELYRSGIDEDGDWDDSYFRRRYGLDLELAEPVLPAVATDEV